MGWTTTSWHDADWATNQTFTEFLDAIDERLKALGIAGITGPYWLGGSSHWSLYCKRPPVGTPPFVYGYQGVGHDVQMRNFLWCLQQIIIDMLGDWYQNSGGFGDDPNTKAVWVQSHDLDGTPRAADYYISKAVIPRWTYDTICQAAGITGGFRRATTPPADWTNNSDAAYSRGTIQVGDIIGPWIFQDIQKLLNLMVWTAPRTTGWGQGYPFAAQVYGVNYPNWGSSYSAIADAKANVNSNWASASWLNEWDIHTYPQCCSFTRANAISATSKSPSYNFARAWRSRSTKSIAIQSTWSGFAYEVDWLTRCVPPTNGLTEWNANGSPITNGTYARWHTQRYTTTGTGYLLQTLGDLTAQPVWPTTDASAAPWYSYCGWQEDDTRTGDIRWTLYSGYESATQAIIRWNTSGGFAYR